MGYFLEWCRRALLGDRGTATPNELDARFDRRIEEMKKIVEDGEKAKLILERMEKEERKGREELENPKG